jgi:hypothetical protein
MDQKWSNMKNPEIFIQDDYKLRPNPHDQHRSPLRHQPWME